MGSKDAAAAATEEEEEEKELSIFQSSEETKLGLAANENGLEYMHEIDITRQSIN